MNIDPDSSGFNTFTMTGESSNYVIFTVTVKLGSDGTEVELTAQDALDVLSAAAAEIKSKVGVTSLTANVTEDLTAIGSLAV